MSDIREWTPDDEKLVPYPDTYIYVGLGGDLALEFREGQKIILKNLQSGHWLPPMRVNKILSTGTTAAEIIIWPMDVDFP